ncbi:membrane-associated oxidoreductase [Actinomadura sp. HBU206391]|uniref:membrane-associated oxidoreductase n=1 Tax=Actinomadura sp. HBU206391 TaxID=2731692 RepID=UPI00164F289F|nr:membrane-associated oxidoreductase [Actinomadura sp. HBU206391]MBC6456768.1 membrane-associated oxidoreductase [Actinomadura sp. HBU206391]
MEIADLTPAERRVWRAFPRGEVVDFRESTDEDPAHGGGWGPDRTVRAEALRPLLLGGVTGDGEIAALRLVGARISGPLNLQYGTVDHAVRLTACHLDHAAILYGAEVRQLNLSESYLPALDAATIRIGGVLRITDCRIPGHVRLGGAKISGAIFCDRAHLGDEQRDRGDGGEPALQLNQATVGDDLYGRGLVVHGQVRLSGARIAGSLNLDDSELSDPGGTALNAETLTVGSDLHAMRLRAEGRVNLRGAHIPGQLNLAYARLSNPGGVALRASSCTAGEFWLREAAPIEGSVNLRRSQFDLLHATPDVWPDQVRLDGLAHGVLAPHLPAGRRLDLLERDEDGYVPQAYEQLTAAYRQVGDDAGARTVQLAKQRRHRTTLPWYARIWGYLQDVTVGYGFRPMRAAAWLLALLLTGAVAYGLHPPAPMKSGETPDFNALFYALDLLLPIIDFGQEKAFNPRGGYQWLSYLLIAAGWILATTIATGITRAVSRQ